MSISVQCPGCGKKLKGKDELAGRRVKCPACGQGIMVPAACSASQAEPTTQSSAVPSPAVKDQPMAPPPPVPQGRRVRWPWYAGGGAVTLCVLAGVVIIAMPGKDRTPTKDGGIAAGPLPAQNATSPSTPNSESKAQDKPEIKPEESAKSKPEASPREEETPAWIKIILDKNFVNVWANAESAYEAGKAFGQVPAVGEKDFLHIEGMMKYVRNGPLTPDALRTKYGPPERVVEEGSFTWYDYGPIRFGVKRNEKHISEFSAQRGFFGYGFVKVAENTIKKNRNR